MEAGVGRQPAKLLDVRQRMLGALCYGGAEANMPIERSGERMSGGVVLDRPKDIERETSLRCERPPHLQQRLRLIREELESQLAESDVERRIGERESERTALVPVDHCSIYRRKRSRDG